MQVMTEQEFVEREESAQTSAQQFELDAAILDFSKVEPSFALLLLESQYDMALDCFSTTSAS